jgi:hypothetical protein
MSVELDTMSTKVAGLLTRTKKVSRVFTTEYGYSVCVYVCVRLYLVFTCQAYRHRGQCLPQLRSTQYYYMTCIRALPLY